MIQIERLQNIMSESAYQLYAVITVTEPVLQQGPNEKIPPYVTYLVTGRDPHGEFNVRRRFREFLLLRNKFVERFTGMYIPPIPSKRTAGNTEERYVEERRRFLHYFCVKIAAKPYLFDSDIFQTFLRGDPDFQRASRLISGHEYALIANIYSVEFKEAAAVADIPKVIIEIEAEAEVLKQVERKLTMIREQIQEVADAKRLFITQYAECYKSVLPRFEQEILSTHGDINQHAVFSNNDAFKERLCEYLHFSEGNPLLDYVEAITYDIRQARALLEAIESRRVFESKKTNFEAARRQSKEELERLKSGRLSIKSFFTSGTKDVQIKELENYIPQYERNEEFLGACLPLSAVAIHQDIQNYKKTRGIDYLTTLQIIAQKQMRILQLYGQALVAAQLRHVSKPVLVSHHVVEVEKPLSKEEKQEEHRQ